MQVSDGSYSYPSISEESSVAFDEISYLSDPLDIEVGNIIGAGLLSTENRGTTCESSTNSLATPSQSSSCGSPVLPSIHEKATHSILHGLKVPPSDYRMSRKRCYGKSDDAELKESLDKLTETAALALSKVDSPDMSGPHASSEDPYGNMIAVALKRILESKTFICVSDLMKVLDIYSRGKTPVTHEKDD